MPKILVAALLSLTAISTSAQEIPAVTQVHMDVLEAQKILLVNEATLPLFYLARSNGEKKFQPNEYFGAGAPDSMPSSMFNQVNRAGPQANEFDQRAGAIAAQPWFDRMKAAAPEFEYGLFRVTGEVGKYNFDTLSFPVRITLGSKFEVQKKKYAGVCKGVTARSGRGHHIPCIAVAGFNKREGALLKLPVPDESVARHLSALHGRERFAYMLLARFQDKPEIVGTSGWSREHVMHIMSATPVALYVFDTNNDKLLAQVAITTKTSAAAGGVARAADNTESGAPATPPLKTVDPTSKTKVPASKSTKAVPTISFD